MITALAFGGMPSIILMMLLVLISTFILSRVWKMENPSGFGETLGKSILVGITSLIGGVLIYMIGVLLFSGMFGAEAMIWIYLFGIYQWVFYTFAVFWVVLTDRIFENHNKVVRIAWSIVFNIITSSIISYTLFVVGGELREKENDKLDAQWEQVVEQELAQEDAEFEIGNYGQGAQTREYYLEVTEIDSVRLKNNAAIRYVNSRMTAEFTLEEGMLDREAFRAKLEQIRLEVQEEVLRSKSVEKSSQGTDKYAELAQKHGYTPSEKSFGPLVQEVAQWGVTPYKEAPFRKVDTRHIENIVYGNYFHFQLDFTKPGEELIRSIKETINLLEETGLDAVDFVVFSDRNETNVPVKICMMQLLEKERQLNELSIEMKEMSPGSNALQYVYAQQCAKRIN